MAADEVTFSIEEARRIRDEMRRLSDELDEVRRTSLRTIPEGEHYAVLLDAVLVARDVGQAPPAMTGNATGFALASLVRWATNVQAFMIMVKAGLWTEAYAVARMGSELAINLVWVAEGGPREHFPDADSRTTAMIHDARYAARVWFDEMHAAGATLLTQDGTPWVDVLASAKPVPHFPRHLKTRAECTAITKELYTFAYRGESTAVHSTAGLLAAHAAGQPPLPPHLIVHNVLVASFLVFAAVGNLLGEERCHAIARRLDGAHKAGKKG